MKKSNAWLPAVLDLLEPKVANLFPAVLSRNFGLGGHTAAYQELNMTFSMMGNVSVNLR